MPDINIESGEEGEGENTSFFYGLLPLCPKSSGQGCSCLRILSINLTLRSRISFFLGTKFVTKLVRFSSQE